MAKPIYVTTKGYRLLVERLHRLQNCQLEIQAQLADAAENGGDGWHDNSAHEDLTRRANEESRKVSDARALLNRAVGVSARPNDHSVVRIGHIVTFYDEDTDQEYRVRVVGHGETDMEAFPVEISYDAPRIAPFFMREVGFDARVRYSGQLHHLSIEAIDPPREGEVWAEPRFVVFEGVDGAGKTTAGQNVAGLLGFVYYPTPSDAFKKERPREGVDKNGTPDERYRYYVDAVRHASAEIQEILASGRGVIVDRYWASTIVGNGILGADVSMGDFSGIFLPHLTVLLTVDPDVQVARLTKRGMTVGDRRMLKHDQADVSRQYREFLESYGPGEVLEIDTSSGHPSDAVSVIVERIMRIENV